MEDGLERPTSAGSRRSLISLESVQSILTSGAESSPVLPPPAEHIRIGGPSSSTVAPTEEFQRKPLFSHSRSMSLAAGGRGGKRLSLSFPVQPIGVSVNHRYTSPSVGQQSPMTPSIPSSAEQSAAPSPTKDSGNFLVALAAQERRVLELREELGRAEGELEKLKRQWAMHEATKKREIRAVEPLRPVSSNLAGTGAGVGLLSVEETEKIELWTAEQKRRRALVNGTLISGGQRSSTSSHRKVISGQRHTRTLSLLSPQRSSHEKPFINPYAHSHAERQPNPLETKVELTRSMTLPSSKNSVASKQPTNSTETANGSDTNKTRHSYQGPPREILLRTGRQMAEDFKEGLWTFIEDLRQATVGDEGVNATASRTESPVGLIVPPKSARKQGTKNGSISPRLATKDRKMEDLVDVKDSFWKEHGVDHTPKRKVTELKKTAKRTGLEVQTADSAKEGNDDDDSWENWDSPDTKPPPSPRWSSSTFVFSEGETSPRTSGSSPRTSTSSIAAPSTSGSKSESIPNITWPSLTDLSPGNIKRTASTIIKELERQALTPTPLEKVSQLSLRGASKSSSPGGVKGKKCD